MTYLGSAIAVVILPWRKPDLWAASPASKFKLLGVPIVPVAGVVTIGLLGYNLYEWLTNDAYFVNNKGSLIYMGAMYVLAISIFVGARIVRNRQGIDLRPDQQGNPGRVVLFVVFAKGSGTMAGARAFVLYVCVLFQ